MSKGWVRAEFRDKFWVRFCVRAWVLFRVRVKLRVKLRARMRVRVLARGWDDASKLFTRALEKSPACDPWMTKWVLLPVVWSSVPVVQG